MGRRFVKSIKFEKTKGWDETQDIETQNKHTAIIVHFNGEDDITWYPRYQDLTTIIRLLILLHGEKEVRSKVLWRYL